MQLVKPSWINHEDNPIYSLDIHPDGLRFATGGQGEDRSGRISIWNIAPVLNKEHQENENIPKLLCQLDNHLSIVNCVRWSHSGKYLASGSDDKLIMIWKKAGATKLDENNIIMSVEVWRCVGTLTGHSNDVLDLAWACHDTWLASCSVDNTIIIWNMEKMPEIVTRLVGHTGLVKGVTWDPVGQYLASQSDDKTLRIWRTKDWKEQICITEPFKECGDMTHVLRLHWSPDGQYLVSAHASNCGGPTAQIIEIIKRPIDEDKKAWNMEMDFVGHRKAVTCIRFNSNLLQKKSDGKTKFCVLATGSRDCSLAIWCTSRKRPIVVINNIFNKSVLDLSWSKDGKQLLACSADGTIAHLNFSEEELGMIVLEEEKMVTLEGLYGKSFTTRHLNQTKITPIMETPELLQFTPPKLSTPPRAPPPVQNGPTVNHATTNGIDSGQNQKTCSNDGEGSKEPKSVTKVENVKQIETRTVDGKRRVTPISLPRDVVDQQSPQSFSSSSEFKTKIVIEQRPDIVQPNVSPSKGTGTPGGAMNTQAVSAQEKHSVLMSNANVDLVAKSVKRRSLVEAEVSCKKLKTCEQMNQQNIRRCSHCETVLEPLACNKAGLVQLQGKAIHYENPRLPDHPSLVKMISDKEEKSLVWQTVLNKQVIVIKANDTLTVVICKDCSLHMLNTSIGTPLQLPILIHGLPSYVTLTPKNYLAIVTTKGYLFVWSKDLSKWTIRDHSLKHVLLSENEENPASILSCSVTEEGIPTISLSNGRCFSYSIDKDWQLVNDASSIVSRMSNTNPLIQKSYKQAVGNNLPLRNLCHHVKMPPVSSSQKLALPKNVSSELCMASFLHQQINAAIALNSPIEFKVILMTLIRFYAQEGQLKPLRLILEDLLGPYQTINGTKWKGEILTFQKHDLLKEALTVLSEHVVCQRLYIEFHDQLHSMQHPMDIC